VSREYGIDGAPNGLPLSRRPARLTSSKMPLISRAEGGRLQRRVRRPGRHRSSCRSHLPTTPAQNHTLHTGRSVGTTHLWNRTRHNGPRSGTTFSTEPRQAQRALIGTTLLWCHLSHNAPSAQRALVPHRHHGHAAQRAFVSHPPQRAFRTTGGRTTPAPRAPARRRGHNAPSGCAIRRIQNEKEMAITLPRVPNGKVQRGRH